MQVVHVAKTSQIKNQGQSPMVSETWVAVTMLYGPTLHNVCTVLHMQSLFANHFTPARNQENNFLPRGILQVIDFCNPDQPAIK